MRGTVLAACVTGSVALHLGALLGAASPTFPGGGGGGAAGGDGASAHRTAGVAVRLLAAPYPAPHPAARAATPAIPATPAPAAASTTPPSPPAPAPAQPAVTSPEWNPDALPPPGAGPTTAPTPGDPDAAYLPRSLLTRAPVPQQSIDLFHPDLAPTGHFRAVLTLFIDDRGVVQRVRFDEADASGLPAVLEDAARQTFLHSAFLPGEIDGRPIRSRLRIEVEYTTEPRTASR